MSRMTLSMIALLAVALTSPAQAQLRVFSCEAEWASLTEWLGGERVEVRSATHALQDPHYIQARPSLISALRRADLAICSGAGLEVGWLPKLMEKANNPKVRPGNPGYFEASAYVTRLDVPAIVDRAKGDVHPEGNPHVQGNPHNIALIAAALAERMAQLDPLGAADYRRNAAKFQEQWDAAIRRWEERAAPLRGRRIVVHHRSWVYLSQWLGLEEVATLEPVSGVAPTAAHLSALLARLGTDGRGADFIIRAPYQSDKASRWLAERTGIPAVMLPLSVGGSDRATDLFGLFEDIVERLRAAAGVDPA